MWWRPVFIKTGKQRSLVVFSSYPLCMTEQDWWAGLSHICSQPFLGLGESSPVCSARSMQIAVALGMPTLAHTKLASHTAENRDLEIQRSSNLPFFPGWNLTALEGSQGGKEQQLREQRAHNPERQHHSWHEKMPVKFSIWLTVCIIIFPTASWITLMFSLWWRTVLVTLKWLVEQCVNLIH